MTYTNAAGLDISGIVNQVQTFVTGSLLPVVTGLVVLSISISLGLKVVKKFGKKLI